MVCPRCVMAVEEIVQRQGLHAVEIDLGTVVIQEEQLSAIQLDDLNAALKKIGFELLDESKSQLVEQMKAVVIRRIFQSERLDERTNWSKIMADECFHAYGHLSAVFSAETGMTLEQFIIRQKVERIKELLSYKQLSLTEIADQLGYSSVAHLSSQFKKITGETPSAFRKHSGSEGRKFIDNLL